MNNYQVPVKFAAEPVPSTNAPLDRRLRVVEKLVWGEAAASGNSMAAPIHAPPTNPELAVRRRAVEERLRHAS